MVAVSRMAGVDWIVSPSMPASAKRVVAASDVLIAEESAAKTDELSVDVVVGKLTSMITLPGVMTRTAPSVDVMPAAVASATIMAWRLESV